MDMFQAFVTVEEKENPVLRVSPAQHSTTSDNCRGRRQGRRSIFPDRLSTTRLRLPRQPAAAKWRHDARVLGALPFGVRGRSPRWFESTSVSFVAVTRVAFSSGCQPGVRVVPSWSVFGSPPSCTVRHCTGQVATDPQSPEGGSQRACPTRGAHPTASGRLGTVALLKQTYPAWQLGSGLFGMPAQEIRVNPLSVIGPWVVAPR